MNASACLQQLAATGIEVLDAEQAARAYGQDTGGGRRRYAGAFRVRQQADIAHVLQLANAAGWALWPVSGGRNFGYGTALPVGDDHYLLDLSALKGIRFDPDSLSATVEAGVTQGELAAALEHAGLDWLVPTTGAGPRGSLIGNALDGGYGLTPVCDHFDALTRLQGWWGNGQAFDHSFAQLGCTGLARSWRAGIGPNPAGLLHQSALGIVGAASIRMQRKPEATRLLLLRFRREADFLASLPALSALQEELPMLAGILFMSDLRVLAGHDDRPLRPAGTATSNATNARAARTDALSARRDHLRALARRRGLSPWLGVGTLFGARSAVAGAVQDLVRRLPRADVHAFTLRQIDWLGRLADVLPQRLSLRNSLQALRSTANMIRGRPDASYLKLAYALQPAEKTVGADAHPARDGCGILWYAPLLPLQAEAVSDFLLGDAEQILREHGFDSLLGATIRSPTVLTCTLPILFDRHDDDAVVRADFCYRALVRAGLARGFPPYRLGSQYMDLLHGNRVAGATPDNGVAEIDPVISSDGRIDFADLLDPKRVLQRGRYPL